MKKVKEVVTKRRNTPVKYRSQSCYTNKVEAIKKWYMDIMMYREENPVAINPNTKKPAIRKELKPLEFYTDKVKKVYGK
jgi:hypothetical protein